MKIIRALAGLLLVIGVIFPVSYKILLLPPIEKQQYILESVVTELKLEEQKGINFKEAYRIKANFNFIYNYDKSRYNKMDIKKYCFIN